ncbi:hypothetical protein ACWKSP_37680 [Micromonosporaceae bacterium Da 78-11]
MRREWFVGRQLAYGAVLVEWHRPFTLWEYAADDEVVLLRSPKDEGPRIDLVFKPVRALNLRTSYPTLALRVAGRDRAAEVLGRLGSTDRTDRVVELIGPDGNADHIVCLALGWREDDGEWWEPSSFAEDLTAGRAVTARPGRPGR